MRAFRQDRFHCRSLALNLVCDARSRHFGIDYLVLVEAHLFRSNHGAISASIAVSTDPPVRFEIQCIFYALLLVINRYRFRVKVRCLIVHTLN